MIVMLLLPKLLSLVLSMLCLTTALQAAVPESIPANTAKALVLDGTPRYELAPVSYFLVDAENSISGDQLIANFDQYDWQLMPNRSGITGTVDGAVWLASWISIAPENIETADFVVKLHNPLADEVEFYWFQNGVEIGRLKNGMGDAYNPLARYNRDYLLSLDLLAGHDYLLLTKVSDGAIVYASPVLYTEQAHSIREQPFLMFYGVFTGAVILVLLYSVALFFATRDGVFLAYALVVICHGAISMGHEGTLTLFWLQRSQWALGYVEYIRAVVPFSAALFTVMFFDLHQRRGVLFYLLCSYMVISIVTALCFWLGAKNVWLVVDRTLGLLVHPTCVAAGVAGYMGRKKGAATFALAWLSLALLVPAYRVMASLGVDVTVDEITDLLALAVFFDFVLISIALSQRIGALNQQRMLAIAKSHTKSQFLAKVGHELRTPLNGIIGLTELLREYVAKKQGREYLKTIQQSGHYLAELINDLLDISKIEEDKIDIESVPFNIRSLVHSIIDVFAHSNASFKGNLAEDIDRRIPVMVKGDPTRIRQILSNLISNALKFTKDGTITVKLECTDKPDMIKLSVIDTGIGIPQDKLVQIFGFFEQESSSTARKYGGSGLGLTISKLLAELMGGSIGVRSRIGKGSSFWVELPLIDQQLEQPAVQSVTSATLVDGQFPDVQPQARTSLRVLVAEDNRVNQMVVNNMLKKLGHDVVVKEDGLTAFEAFKEAEQPFDIILMDCDMPVMNGYESTKVIREFEHEAGWKSRAIIALTADALKENVNQCYECGMNGFLSKPITLESLSSALDRVMVDLGSGSFIDDRIAPVDGLL